MLGAPGQKKIDYDFQLDADDFGALKDRSKKFLKGNSEPL